MKIAVTGGGTGGHIYPALEVARCLRDQGVEVVYLGSLRGPEGQRATEAGFEFHGFPSLPLLSLRTPAGWKGVLAALRSTILAKRTLKTLGIQRVFGTGGYGAAPVTAAARGLGLPYVLHESNSIPGRTNRMFANQAKAVSCVFRRTLREMPKAIRTGQPIRKELRLAAAKVQPSQNLVLVTGGSQGSAFLNEIAPRAAALLPETRWLHATGPAHIQKVLASDLPEGYVAKPYLETDEMALAYHDATLAVGRSGGTLAEYALFGLPSVLIPLPTSADNHQLHNAKEFVEMEAATLLEQRFATPELLAEAVSNWLCPELWLDGDPVPGGPGANAVNALTEWDVPDATERIAELILK